MPDFPRSLTLTSFPGLAAKASIALPAIPKGTWVITSVVAKLVTFPWQIGTGEIVGPGAVSTGRGASPGVIHVLTNAEFDITNISDAAGATGTVIVSDGATGIVQYEWAVSAAPPISVDRVQLQGSPIFVATTAGNSLSFTCVPNIPAGTHGVMNVLGYSTTAFPMRVQWSPDGGVTQLPLGILDQPGQSDYTYSGALTGVQGQSVIVQFTTPASPFGQYEYLEVSAMAI